MGREAWIVGLLAAAPVVALFVAPRLRRPALLPLADAAQLDRGRRRARLAQAGLLAAAGALVAATALAVTRPVDTLGSLVRGQSTVVVLDVSSSVGDIVFEQIANTLRGIVDTTGTSERLGLVLFSDIALEALAPGTRAAELEPFIRYFEPIRDRGLRPRHSVYQFTGPGVTLQGETYPLSPWSTRLSGGTQISIGLRAAREALERSAGGTGRILLISDLQEADEDRPRLMQELVLFSGDSTVDLRVIAIPPATGGDMAVFRRILGNEEYVVSSLSLDERSRPGHAVMAATPLAMLAFVGVLGLVLAVAELLGVPLAWGRRMVGREAL
jgi:hypothetical protein